MMPLTSQRALRTITTAPKPSVDVNSWEGCRRRFGETTEAKAIILKPSQLEIPPRPMKKNVEQENLADLHKFIYFTMKIGNG
jgi:hypothetical protein